MDRLNVIKTPKLIKHIFFGKEVKRLYKFVSNLDEHSKEPYYLRKPCIEEIKEVIRRTEVLIMERDEEETFNVGEEIYINLLEKYTTIEKRTRSTNGEMIYNITYIRVIDDDEETKKSWEEATKLLEAELPNYAEFVKKQTKKELQNKIETMEEQVKNKKAMQEIREWQSKNPSKIKGVFNCKIPANKDPKQRDTFLVSAKTAKEFFEIVRNNIPKEYLVCMSPFDIDFIDLKNKTITRGIKEIFSK